MKKSFVLYQDQAEIFNALSDEQAGKLIKAIFDFTKGEKPILSPTLSVAFISVKQTLLRDLEKWNNICDRNGKNIKKRWLKHTKNTSGKIGIPDNVDSDSDNDIYKLKPCSHDQLWTIAKDLELPLETVVSKYNTILDKIATGEFPYKTVYFTLRNWLRGDIEKGWLSKVDEIGKLQLQAQSPQNRAKVDEALKLMKGANHD